MFRRWIRALARTGVPGRPFPVPPKAGRHPRTLLRLEAVEDRTLASITAVEPPKFLSSAGAHLGKTPKPTTPTPSDDKSQTTADGSDQAAPQDQFGPNLGTAAADTPVLLTGGFTLSSTAVADLPAPVTRHQETLDVQSAGDSDHPDDSSTPPAKSRSDVQAGQSAVSVATDAGNTSGASGPSQTPADHSTAPAGRSTVDVVVTGQTAVAVGQSSRRQDATNGPTTRAVTVESDSALPRGNRASRSSGNGTAAPTASPAIPADLPDAALLQRFVANREEAAFTALVRRYAPVVLGVCQRVLGDFHAAQDASQATFIVLARKAGMLDRTSPLGGWLYKVAYHLALRSRGVTAKQRLGERAAADEAPVATEDTTELDQREVNQVLREELQELPEKYRAPLALVYFDGRSHADAAQAIGLPRGSMAKRVGVGLDRLRERLVSRGVSL
jgi:RNA polymerase sigma factor (sigma-70 family)